MYLGLVLDLDLAYLIGINIGQESAIGHNLILGIGTAIKEHIGEHDRQGNEYYQGKTIFRIVLRHERRLSSIARPTLPVLLTVMVFWLIICIGFLSIISKFHGIRSFF